jgi:acylphosphatase
VIGEFCRLSGPFLFPAAWFPYNGSLGGGVARGGQARYFLVEGRVQGVGYRFFVEHEANRLGLRGYVRNLYDGRVEVYALGEPEVLERLRERLEQGPSGSRVERVTERQAPNQSYKDFSIEASGNPTV